MKYRAAGTNDRGADYKSLSSINEVSQISSPSDWENNDAFVKKAKRRKKVSLRREAEVKAKASWESLVQRQQFKESGLD